MPTKTLRLIFENFDERQTVINIPDPAEPVVEATVSELMDKVIDSDVFLTSGGAITKKIRAEVVERSVDLVYDPS